MKRLIKVCWILFGAVVIAQAYHALARTEDVKVEPYAPDYVTYGECIDITNLISDIEIVNDIDCQAIIYEGEVIYVK